MSKKIILFLLTLGIGSATLLSVPHVVRATNKLEQNGRLQVENGGTSSVIDPERPDTGLELGEGPSTTGPLRFDYAPTLRFGAHKISKGQRVYSVLAQQSMKGPEVRGNIVQITDQRAVSTGWTLQVKQEQQYSHEQSGSELKGAVLSLDKGWASTSGTSEAPTLKRETILLDSIGEAYEVARATPGTGQGIWAITFGATADNTMNQEATLKPLVDVKGKALIDPFYNKPAYSNSAITLSIPDKTEVLSGSYVTKITWLLAELP